jgi:hypothetical protein
VITGYIIGESMRAGAVFEPPGLRIRKVSRLDVSSSATGGQPDLWTLIEYETDTEDVTGLADALAGALRADGGWYADFVAGDERVVAFGGKVFRFPRGDEAGRAEAVAYGRSVGVPDHQLDWAD